MTLPWKIGSKYPFAELTNDSIHTNVHGSLFFAKVHFYVSINVNIFVATQGVCRILANNKCQGELFIVEAEICWKSTIFFC